MKLRHSLSGPMGMRLIYDAVFAFGTFGLAFLLRFSWQYLYGDHGTPELSAQFVSLFVTFAPVYVILTIGGLALAGAYRDAIPSPGSLLREGRIGVALVVSPLLLVSVAHFLNKEWFFPRSVILLTMAGALLSILAPRALKRQLLRKMNIHISQHRKGRARSVLVIGGAGYIGSILTKRLLSAGYRVRVLDSLIFGDEAIRSEHGHPSFELVEGDLRNVESVVRAIRGMDSVVHLGGLVGDPACSVDDDVTIDINLTATRMIAEVCKAFGVQRFIFASTCSVYGASDGDHPLTEESELNPVSLYARTKIASERVLLDLTKPDFQPTMLRFSTLFGLSPRPRFDLVVNLLTAKAVVDRKISVFGGSQWRPYVHTRDLAAVLQGILEAPLSKVGGEVFNVGSDENNHQVIDVAKMIVNAVPGTEMDVNGNQEDNRNYLVSFKKLHSTIGLPKFISVREGIEEMRNAIQSGLISDYRSPIYSNVQTTRETFLGEGLARSRPTAQKIMASVQVSNEI